MLYPAGAPLTVDREYAWIVLGCCSLFNFLGIGFLFGSIGYLTNKYEEVFGVDKTQTSWVGSVLFAILFISGPVAAYVIDKLGIRKTALLASLVHISAFAISAAATQIWHVILSFAIFSGFAVCCCHICTVRILTIYFDRYRHMAYATGAIGSDLAAVAFPFLTPLILNQAQTYTHGILYMSALLTPAVVCSLTFVERSSAVQNRHQEGTTHTTEQEPCNDVNSADIKLDQTEPTASPLLNQSTELDQPPTADDDEQEMLDNNNERDSEKIYGDTTKPLQTDKMPNCLTDHLSVLTTPSILVFLVNCLLWNLGASVSIMVYTFYTDKGYDETQASLGMTMFGVGSLAGSLSVALVSIILRPNKLCFHIFSNLLMGVSALCLPLLAFNIVAMTISLALMGFSYGFICANLSAVIEHINGSRLLYLVYSYEMAVAGVGSLIGPVAGAQIEKQFGLGTQFYFSAAAIFAAFALFICYAVIDRSILKRFSMSVEPTNASRI